MKRSFEMDLLLGMAQVMAENDQAEVALWSEYLPTWDEAGQAYTLNPEPQPAGAIAIYVDRYPAEVDCVTLADYPVEDSPSLSDSVVGVNAQVRCRDLDTVKGITSDLFALFQGRWGGMLGPVTLVSARRASGTSLGQDGDGRQGRSESYYLRVHRPSTHRQ